MSLRQRLIREVVDYDNMVNRRVTKKTFENLKVAGDPVKPPNAFEKVTAFDIDTLFNKFGDDLGKLIDNLREIDTFTAQKQALEFQNNPEIDNLKQQVRDLQDQKAQEEDSSPEGLSEQDNLMYDREIRKLTKEIDKKKHSIENYSSKIKSEEDDIRITGYIILSYNALALYLIHKARLSSLRQNDRMVIDDKFEKILPLVQKVDDIAQKYNIPNKGTLHEIAQNISNKNYQPVGHVESSYFLQNNANEQVEQNNNNGQQNNEQPPNPPNNSPNNGPNDDDDDDGSPLDDKANEGLDEYDLEQWNVGLRRDNYPQNLNFKYLDKFIDQSELPLKNNLVDGMRREGNLVFSKNTGFPIGVIKHSELLDGNKIFYLKKYIQHIDEQNQQDDDYMNFSDEFLKNEYGIAEPNYEDFNENDEGEYFDTLKEYPKLDQEQYVDLLDKERQQDLEIIDDDDEDKFYMRNPQADLNQQYEMQRESHNRRVQIDNNGRYINSYDTYFGPSHVVLDDSRLDKYVTVPELERPDEPKIEHLSGIRYELQKERDDNYVIVDDPYLQEQIDIVVQSFDNERVKQNLNNSMDSFLPLYDGKEAPQLLNVSGSNVNGPATYQNDILQGVFVDNHLINYLKGENEDADKEIHSIIDLRSEETKAKASKTFSDILDSEYDEAVGLDYNYDKFMKDPKLSDKLEKIENLKKLANKNEYQDAKSQQMIQDKIDGVYDEFEYLLRHKHIDDRLDKLDKRESDHQEHMIDNVIKEYGKVQPPEFDKGPSKFETVTLSKGHGKPYKKLSDEERINMARGKLNTNMARNPHLDRVKYESGFSGIQFNDFDNDPYLKSYQHMPRWQDI